MLHRVSDPLRRIKQVVIVQVRVAGRRLMVRMTEQPTDHGKRFLVHGGMAGEGMAQIVNPDMAKTCAFADAFPRLGDIAHLTPIAVVPE